ncbi:haemagglutination activity domain protein [Pseudanabaena sp. ABRG5-3]|nr:haemagglutination activity domain protein [Pseudanabaena sp. ABRG5-3]
MKSVLGMYWATTAIAIALSPIVLTETVTAQSITAAQDGTNTVVLPNGKQFDITGGTQAGANLFHSFHQFGLSQGQIANFLSQPNIQNIFGRVVGGDPSVINGLIQLTGGNSNLYIMNPAGIIFGSNASLNVPASFTATTANGIQVGNSWFGMNTSASDLKNLTGIPNAFAFTSPTTALTQSQTTGAIVNQGNLTVSQGKSITLVGGIVINTGAIGTDNGTINIVAVPNGKYVRITPEGGVLSFDLPIATQKELGNAKPLTGIDLPKLLAGSGITAPTQAGTAIAAGNLTAANINILANRYDTAQASLNAANIQQGWNFVFIDSTVKDYQTLIDGTNGGSSITVINPDQYGIQKVTETLASVTGANSLHIVSEGDVGNFWLGKDFVSTENIANYANELQAWKTALSPAANILLYACNLASGENGAALVQAVKNYTGHEVSASTDLTGSSNLGGNWNLEYQTGNINTGVVFNSEAQNRYDGRLVTFTATNINDAGAGSLRQAILDANALAGADTIRFDPTAFNGAQAAITLASTLAINTTTGDLNISGAFGASNVTVSGNNAVGVFDIVGNGNTTFDSLRIINGKGVNGGGITNNGSGALIIINSTISSNTATNSGGGIASNGAVTLTNSIVSSNAAIDGGGIVSNGVVTLTNSTVSSNTATNNGGGIISNGAVTLTNSTVSSNTANTGGGIISNGAVTLTNSTVSSNTAIDGGGIFGGGAVTLTNSTVSDNTATNDGGGIVSTGAVTLTNSTVSGNRANTGGGIVSTGAVTLTNSTVSGNTATNDGGGIVSNAVTLTNSTVSGNTANNGGGIVSTGLVTLTNSTVSGNTANTNGGGIVSNAVTLTNSTVSSNTATNGGGIVSNGVVTLTNSTVSSNTANTGGGGIVSNAVTLTNSTVSSNRANIGGGIFSTGSVTLTNSTVSSNTANIAGGGIVGNNGGTITNSTITNNTANIGGVGGIFRLGGIFTITNSIIAGNFDRGLQAPDLASSAAGVGFTNGGNNLIGANNGFAATFPNSSLVGTIVNPVNPQLAPLANYGGPTLTHALLPNSPALNAGNNANAPVGNDQRGATRIFGGVVDIGAFESQGFSLTPLANTTPQSTNINTSFVQPLGVQVTENFVNSPIPAPNILVTFTPPSSSANGVFAGNTNVLTNNRGIAIAPTFTANGILGNYEVTATATGFKPATFTLTNKVAGGFGGVFPSREDVEGRSPRLDEQDLDISFTKVLCLDASIANAQTDSIPTCKDK